MNILGIQEKYCIDKRQTGQLRVVNGIGFKSLNDPELKRGDRRQSSYQRKDILANKNPKDEVIKNVSVKMIDKDSGEVTFILENKKRTVSFNLMSKGIGFYGNKDYTELNDRNKKLVLLLVKKYMKENSINLPPPSKTRWTGTY